MIHTLINSQSDFGRLNQRTGFAANFKPKGFSRDFGNNGSHRDIGRHFQRDFRYDIAMINGFNDALPLVTITELHGVVLRIIKGTILVKHGLCQIEMPLYFPFKTHRWKGFSGVTIMPNPTARDIL